MDLTIASFITFLGVVISGIIIGSTFVYLIYEYFTTDWENLE